MLTAAGDPVYRDSHAVEAVCLHKVFVYFPVAVNVVIITRFYTLYTERERFLKWFVKVMSGRLVQSNNVPVFTSSLLDPFSRCCKSCSSSFFITPFSHKLVARGKSWFTLCTNLHGPSCLSLAGSFYIQSKIFDVI